MDLQSEEFAPGNAEPQLGVGIRCLAKLGLGVPGAGGDAVQGNFGSAIQRDESSR
jgi:hypothetical protein